MATLIPRVSVVIAVDTAYVASHGTDGQITSGVFLIDNMVRRGSTHEATLQLHTVCNAGDLIGFHCVPVDGAGSSSDQVIITQFLDDSGDVFTGAGHPRQQPPIGNGPAGNWWVGQVMKGGTETYTIALQVTAGQLQPVMYDVWVEATITAS
jgi:hypothetical protein